MAFFSALGGVCEDLIREEIISLFLFFLCSSEEDGLQNSHGLRPAFITALNVFAPIMCFADNPYLQVGL